MSTHDETYRSGSLEILTDEDNDIYPRRTKAWRLFTVGTSNKYDLSEGIPFLTQKRVWEHGVKTELLWFLQGKTNIKFLEDRGVSIWTDNAFKNYVEETDRDLLEKEGSQEWDEEYKAFQENIRNDEAFAQRWGDLGRVYGHWWRGPPGRDQLGEALQGLKDGEKSTRYVVDAWSPKDVQNAVLPPCHYAFELHEKSGELHTIVNQRSTDSFLGEPFNVASYSVLTEYLAQQAGLEPGMLHHNHGNHHFYIGFPGTEEDMGRARWYADDDNREYLRHRVEEIAEAEAWSQMKDLADTLDDKLPPGPPNKIYDHVPRVLEQYGNSMQEAPTVNIADKPIQELDTDDITVSYEEGKPPSVRATLSS